MKRLALAGATATLALGFATTAMDSGPMSGHRHAMKPHHNAPAVADQVVQWNQVLQQVLGANVAGFVLDRVLRHPDHR